MKLNLLTKNLLGAAAILIILGAGNLTVGSYKSQHYTRILSKAERELASREPKSIIPLSDPMVGLDQKLQNLRRLKARVDFYNFTILGGKVFLSAAGILLLLALVISKNSESPSN